MDKEVLKEWEKEYNKQLKFNAGVEFDIERVIYAVFYEFDESQEPRFSIFCKVWKESKLGLIFNGRDSFRDLYELSTDIFCKVKKYAKAIYKEKENNVLVRYAAIYMLYSFYFKQPCRPKVRIKLSYDEFKDISALMDEARKEIHYDILYAWNKLILSNAFHYSVVGEQMGIEVAKTLERKEDQSNSSVQPSNQYFKSKEFRNMMRRLTKAHDNYVKVKNAFTQDSVSGHSLNLMDVDLIKNIEELTKDEEDEPKMKGDKSQPDDIGEKRKRLKEQYFSKELDPGPREGLRFDGEEDEEEEEWTPGGSGKKKPSSKKAVSSIKPEKKLPKHRGRKRTKV